MHDEPRARSPFVCVLFMNALSRWAPFTYIYSRGTCECPNIHEMHTHTHTQKPPLFSARASISKAVALFVCIVYTSRSVRDVGWIISTTRPNVRAILLLNVWRARAQQGVSNSNPNALCIMRSRRYPHIPFPARSRFPEKKHVLYVYLFARIPNGSHRASCALSQHGILYRNRQPPHHRLYIYIYVVWWIKNAHL